MESKFEAIIPIQDEESVKRHNDMCADIYDKYTPLKSTGEHLDELVDKLFDEFDEVADKGGWYQGDAVKISIKIEYEPEDK